VEREVRVREVEELTGRSGTTRFVLRDDDGTEYTTFRARIGQEAMRFRGKRARIEFHEEERRGFHNVYLDAIGPPPEPSGPSEDGGRGPTLPTSPRGTRRSRRRRGSSAPASRRRRYRPRSSTNACTPSRSSSPTTSVAQAGRTTSPIATRRVGPITQP
jgi:hypothetical protein